jgi:hypothetical protein
MTLANIASLDDAILPLKTWADSQAPHLRVINTFVGATTKNYKSTPYLPLFKRPTEGTSMSATTLPKQMNWLAPNVASLEERLENAGDKKKQKIDKKNLTNPRIHKQREGQKGSPVKEDKNK